MRQNLFKVVDKHDPDGYYMGGVLFLACVIVLVVFVMRVF
jgi:hypothetical protein